MTIALDERLTMLERRVHRWQLITLATIALATAFALGSIIHRTPDEIRARAFVVVGRSGEVMARLGASELDEDAPLLRMHVPRNGGDVLVGSNGEDLAGVMIYGHGDVLGQFSSDKDGSPMFSVRGSGSRTTISGNMILMKDAAGRLAATPTRLEMRDASGKTALFSTPTDARPAATGNRQ
jgi:hypothetical protein